MGFRLISCVCFIFFIDNPYSIGVLLSSSLLAIQSLSIQPSSFLAIYFLPSSLLANQSYIYWHSSPLALMSSGLSNRLGLYPSIPLFFYSSIYLLSSIYTFASPSSSQLVSSMIIQCTGSFNTCILLLLLLTRRSVWILRKFFTRLAPIPFSNFGLRK